jgi:hypothetical protein
VIVTATATATATLVMEGLCTLMALTAKAVQSKLSVSSCSCFDRKGLVQSPRAVKRSSVTPSHPSLLHDSFLFYVRSIDSHLQ